MDWDDNRLDGLVAGARLLLQDSEPDYDAYWRDLESLEGAMANVATYDDWFTDSPIVAQQQCGGEGA